MKKLVKSLLSFSTIFIAITNTHATSYQVFANLNFANPAALNSVKNEEVILGGMVLFNRFQFNGTSAGVGGVVTSNTTDFLPYGRVAMRLSPKWVASFDVTQPYFTNIQYPLNSIANMFSTATVIRDVNYSPKVSYQINDKFALGVGFDANNLYNAQLNFVVPPSGNMVNKVSSWAYGWDIGAFYMLRPTTLLNFSFYSQIVQHSKGFSSWGGTTNNALSADVKLPATVIGNIVELMSTQLALSGTLRYSFWNTLQYTVLQNTALGTNVLVPANFYNNISAEVAARYQVNNKWAVIGAFDYEPNIQPTFTRNIGLPTYTRYIPAVGAEYEWVKGLKTKLIYAYVYSRPPIAMSIPGATITGREAVNVNAFDLTFSYDI